MGWISVFQGALLHVFGCLLPRAVKGNAPAGTLRFPKALHIYLYWHPSADLGIASHVLQLCVKAALKTKKLNANIYRSSLKQDTDNREYPK